jgi:hypothetical protein
VNRRWQPGALMLSVNAGVLRFVVGKWWTGESRLFRLCVRNQSLSRHSLLWRLCLLHLLQPFLHHHDLLLLGEPGKKELNLKPHAPWRST